MKNICHAILKTRNLTTGYLISGKEKILCKSVDLVLEPSRLVCLLGPNGSGKSTLLRTLCQLLQPIRGDIEFLSRPLESIPRKELAKSMALVLTNPVRVDFLKVKDLLFLGRSPYSNWFGRFTTEDENAVLRVTTLMNLQSLQDRLFNSLSDGEKQKILIARALCQEPKFVLLDEPTSFLDYPAKVELMQTLWTISRTRRTSFLLSTHDLDLALKHADEIWLLEKDQSLACNTPEDLVLQGRFQNVFETENVSFNLHNGKFESKKVFSETIFVQGEEPALFWTQNALQRTGFQLDSCARIIIEVEKRKNGWLWKVPSQLGISEHNSIHDLLLRLASQYTFPCY